ncbi:MAG: hypothetical protein J5999_00325 [Oscillospiraceae bacterium]|nr:hypothetical protein [Oscillospiraceae bacterium]
MSKYILNTMIILLTLMIYRRSVCGYIGNNWKTGRKAIAVSLSVGVGLVCIAVIIFLTFFEACFVCCTAAVGFLLRHQLAEIFKAQYARKHGKLHAAKTAGIICFSLWLGLALFYRTDIGTPIGLKNYLYHKYNEEFKYIGVKPDGANYGFYPINGNCETDKFNVVRKKYLSVGSRLLASDNYYGIIIREDYQDFIKGILKKYYDDADVEIKFQWSGISNMEYMSDVFDKSASLDEFLKYQKINGDSHNVAEMTITLPQKYLGSAESQKLISQFSNELADITNYVTLDFIYSKEKRFNLGYTYVIINYSGEVLINNHEKG